MDKITLRLLLMTYFEESGEDSCHTYYDVVDGFHIEHNGDNVNVIGIPKEENKHLFEVCGPTFGTYTCERQDFLMPMKVYKLVQVLGQ